MKQRPQEKLLKPFLLGGCEGRLDCNCYPAIGGDGEVCGGGGGGRGAGCHSGRTTFRLPREKVNLNESFLNNLLIELKRNSLKKYYII